MAAGNQTRRILIKVDTTNARGIREIAEQMGLLNDKTKKLSNNMSFLTNAFKGWLGFLGVREVIRMSDEMQNLGNRLKVIAQEGEDTDEIMKKLLAVAERTNQPLSNVAETYARMGVAMKEINPSADSLLSLTETLINTFRLSGSTTTETVNTIIQLSQAFASAELRGQELRSVMEQNATMGIMLRKVFGRDLYEKAKKGMITTAEVLKILSNNMAQINKDAQQLTPTVEQTLSKAMNRLQLAIHNLNTGFGVSRGLADSFAWAIENLGIVALSAASVAVPALTYAVRALIVSLLPLNPLVILISSTAAALAGVVALFADDWGIDSVLSQLRIGFYELKAELYDAKAAWNEFIGGFGTSGNAYEKSAKVLREMAENSRIRAKALRIELDASKEMEKQQNKQALSFEDLIKKYDSLDKKNSKPLKIREELALLNEQFLRDGDIVKYMSAFHKFELGKINRQFREGRMDVFKYHEQLRDFSIRELNSQLREGTISLQQFNQAVGEEKFKVLDEQVKAGKISLEEYNSELTKLEDKIRPGSAFHAGVSNYINSVGSISSNIAKGVEQTFGHLEKSFIEFTKTGKFNFREFTNAVLDDLNKIIIRSMVIRPFAQAILSSWTDSPTTGSALSPGNGQYGSPDIGAARGMAFDRGNVIPFARGGIVDSPTGFMFGGGRKGVMGEAGPEAILPLQRGAGGNLGVAATVTPVTVNIINQSGAEVDQTETTGPNGERTIEILIHNKVREGIVGGKFDKAMKSSFGLNRKGS